MDRTRPADVILGVTDGDDAGAVVLVEGRLVSAVNEERLNRKKMSIGFPRLAIPEALRLAGVSPSDVGTVAMAAENEKFNPVSRDNKGWFEEPSAMARVRNEISSALARPLGGIPAARSAYRVLKGLTLGRRKSGARQILGELGVRAPMTYHHHHRCHAVSAFAGSGLESGLAISLDGGGDGASSQVYTFGPEGDRLVHQVDSFDSIGNYYAYVTHICGYRASIHEGKITGLAAHGVPRYLDLFRSLVDYDRDAGTIRNRGRVFFNGAIARLKEALPADWEHADLAASVQKHLEEVVVAYVRHWVKATGKTRLCLSGGVFSNVLLNQRIADLPEVESVYVFPAMGDGGLASGAAWSEWLAGFAGRRRPALPPLQHVYLGPGYDEAAIERDLSGSGLPFTRPADLPGAVAALIHEGKVVARFDGPMEYGPRALGNRTIMYRTSDPSVNTWLNKRLNRTEFMPFAPACLAGHEPQLFQWNPGSAFSARFMTITLDCSPWMKEHCPAVVHIDGTARPQMVHADTNPGFHAVLKRYHEMSGVPCFVNTSFNMHEEPIVCSPGDAIRSFKAGRLDRLVLGPFLVSPEAGAGVEDMGESASVPARAN